MPRPRSTTTNRPARLAAGLLAAGLTVVPLAGCTLTSHNVSCSGSSCTVALSGDGAEAEIFGTTIEFAGVQDGRATLGVAGASVTCAEGESVTAGPLQVTCSSVTDGTVEITATLG